MFRLVSPQYGDPWGPMGTPALSLYTYTRVRAKIIKKKVFAICVGVGVPIGPHRSPQNLEVQ
jgi:hypothetical protein